VYYCQACDDPHLMEPDDGVARCPACGSVDPHPVIRPLFVVTGASGSGKTTIFPELLSRMSGWCAVFDADWLIDPLGRAAKDGQIDWAAFTDTWLHVAHGVAQNGLPTLLLAPFIPREPRQPARPSLDRGDALSGARLPGRGASAAHGGQAPLARPGHRRPDRVRPLAA
jgi:hypothetical protein